MMKDRDFNLIIAISGVLAFLGTVFCFGVFGFALIVDRRFEGEILIAAVLLLLGVILCFFSKRE
ncbi:MAG: hypothetical protein WD490_07615 [Opitutales bacterium]